MRRGFGLAYTLAMIAVIVVFLTAFLVRGIQTLRFAQFDQQLVRARHLADSGVRLALVWMRDRDPNFYQSFDPHDLRSDRDLGLDAASLGGTFKLSVYEENELPSDLVPPEPNGTYRAVVCEATAGRRTARSAALVKVSSPDLSFLLAAQDDLTLGYSFKGMRTLSGPMVSNTGNVQLMHAIHQLEGAVVTGDEVNVSGTLRAARDIFVQNVDMFNLPLILPPRQLNGTYPPAPPYVHNDLPAGPMPPNAHLVFPEPLVASPQSFMMSRLPDRTKLLGSLASFSSRVEVDVSAMGPEVLVEFMNGQCYLSQTATRPLGRFHDQDLFQGVMGSDPALATDLAYDDPEFPNDATGDYFEVKKVIRGALLQTIPLSASGWTVIYLKTTRTDYLTQNGRPSGPVLLVRGKVRGKVVLVYDCDESLDPDVNRLALGILGDHEAYGQDGPTLPGVGPPGVPGGLLLEDRNIKLTPDGTGSSPDYAMVVCRGIVETVGLPAYYFTRVWRGGTAVDLNAEIEGLAAPHLAAYGQPVDDQLFQADFLPGDLFRTSKWARDMGANSVRSALFGVVVACGNGVYVLGGLNSSDRVLRLTAEGNILLGERLGNGTARIFPLAGGHPLWGEVLARFGTPPPPGRAASDRVGELPLRMRNARDTNWADFNLVGGFHGTEWQPNLRGNARYDYRFLELPADVVSQQMGLPVSIIPMSWQRL